MLMYRRRPMARPAVAASLCFALLFAAGCGGGASTHAASGGTPLQVAYYNRLVTAINAYTRAHQGDTAEAARTGRERRALRRARTSIAALDPPPGLDDEQRAILADLDRKLALLPKELTAYEAHDPQALTALIDADQSLTEKLMRTLAAVRRVAAASR